MVKIISKFIIHNYELLMIIFILITASFLRLYRISEYMTFLGDEGRDALVVKGILEGNFTLLGPRASAGDFFLGPIYYYLIAPFLWLFKYDPVGPAIMVALLGVATVYLVYRVGKEFFGVKAAIFASSLYAVSPLIIAYSRSSWNPNPMPFFSLLALYVLYKAIIKRSWKLFLAVGVLLGIAMQLHYLSMFLAVIIAFYMLAGQILFYIDKHTEKIFFRNYAQVFIGFLIGFSPFLAFELRHGFPNIRTILNFVFLENASDEYQTKTSFLGVVFDVFFRLFGRLISRFPPPEQVNVDADFSLWALKTGTILIAVLSIILVIKHKNKLQLLLVYLWLFLGILLFGFYKRSIHDYYFAFMFPLPFLLVGNLISSLFYFPKVRFIGIIFGSAIFLYLFIFNLDGMPFRYVPNRQKDQVKMISDFVLSKTSGKPFNFALITGGNSDHSYRYFFELVNRGPVMIENEIVDPERKTVTDQLLVICEINDCKPLGHPLWEIAGFGGAEIVGEWDVSVVKIYKLEHYKE